MSDDLDPDPRAPTICRNGEIVPSRLRGAVIAIGNFDGLHLGHQGLIASAHAEAAERGSLSAVLTFEPHPRAYFGGEGALFRLTPEAVKLKVLARLAVDGIFIRRFDADLAATTAGDFIAGLMKRELGAASLIVGSDFHFGRGRTGTPAMLAELARGNGLSLRLEETVDVEGTPVSSSRIRTALAAGDVALANRLLGYRWFASGSVAHGDKRGRTLGYPTANLPLDPGCRLAYGIYAVRAALADGTIRGGVASFGSRPTFDDGPPRLETYLFDFRGDLYDQPIEVEFLEWIRGEERFDSAEALVERMRIDEARARRILHAAAGAPPAPSMIG